MADEAPAVREAPGLAAALAGARERSGLTADALTVMAHSNDPYRLDTPKNRSAAAWFASMVARFLPDGRAIHLRGLHYRIASAGDVVRPDGWTYINDAEAWMWLGDASQAARWLGLVPWHRIRDERNSAPIVHAKPDRNVGADAFTPWGRSAPRPSASRSICRTSPRRRCPTCHAWRRGRPCSAARDSDGASAYGARKRP